MLLLYYSTDTKKIKRSNTRKPARPTEYLPIQRISIPQLSPGNDSKIFSGAMLARLAGCIWRFHCRKQNRPKFWYYESGGKLTEYRKENMKTIYLVDQVIFSEQWSPWSGTFRIRILNKFIRFVFKMVPERETL